MHFVNGFLVGLSLAALVGPLLFALLESSLRRGTRAGLRVAVGIWFSDLVFVVGSYFGVQVIAQLVQWEQFESSLSGIGGIVLLFTGGQGVYASRSARGRQLLDFPKGKPKRGDFLIGFLLNTINPFTVFFGFGVFNATNEHLPKGGPHLAEVVGGIMSAIVLTDTLKVLFARVLRRWLTPSHVSVVKMISGIVLIGFGVFLLLRPWI
jgi:threonine/homoserine/homoserine lactone efflux protein